MKTAVAYLEPHMEKADAGGKGMVVLATVKGDVHDIGKNLVDIILTNNGYMVYNLGIKIAITEMIDKALEVERRRDRHERPAREVDDHHAREPRRAEHARARRPRAGAARRRRAHAQLRRARPARGLRRPRLLRQGRVRGSAHDGHAHGRQAHRRPRSRVRARGRRPQAAAAQERARRGRAAGRDPRRAPTSRSTCTIFTPPFVGSRVAKGISLDDIAAYINETALFRNQWQFRPEKGGGGERREFKARIRPDAARAARHREAGVAARARGRVGLLRGQRRGQRPRRVEGRHAHAGVAALRVPAPAQGAVPLHRRLLPARRVGRARLRRVPRRDDGHACAASARRSCSPPTSTRTTCCCTACRSR